MTAMEVEQPNQPRRGGNKPGSDPVGLHAGQETLLTQDVQDKICAALRANWPMSTAAAAAGMKIRTVNDWLHKGAQEIEPYASFYDAVMTAQAVGEGRLIKKLDEASEAGDTKSTQFLLERRHRHNWGRVDKVEHEAHIDQTLTIQLSWPGAQVSDPDSYLELPVHPNVVDAEVVDDHLASQLGAGDPQVTEDHGEADDSPS